MHFVLDINSTVILSLMFSWVCSTTRKKISIDINRTAWLDRTAEMLLTYVKGQYFTRNGKKWGTRGLLDFYFMWLIGDAVGTMMKISLWLSGSTSIIYIDLQNNKVFIHIICIKLVRLGLETFWVPLFEMTPFICQINFFIYSSILEATPPPPQEPGVRRKILVIRLIIYPFPNLLLFQNYFSKILYSTKWIKSGVKLLQCFMFRISLFQLANIRVARNFKEIEIAKRFNTIVSKIIFHFSMAKSEQFGFNSTHKSASQKQLESKKGM